MLPSLYFMSFSPFPVYFFLSLSFPSLLVLAYTIYQDQYAFSLTLHTPPTTTTYFHLLFYIQYITTWSTFALTRSANKCLGNGIITIAYVLINDVNVVLYITHIERKDIDFAIQGNDTCVLSYIWWLHICCNHKPNLLDTIHHIRLLFKVTNEIYA